MLYLYKLKFKELKIKKIEIRINELLLKNGHDSAKALKEAQDKIKNVGRGQLVNPFDKKVVDKLIIYIKEEKDYAKNNDPVNIALAQLNSAKPADVPKALEAVVAGLLLKSGITMDKLSDKTRQDLANILRSTSDQLIDIINNSRIPENVKQEKKQAIIKEMLKNSSFLLGSYVTGASQAALATGNVQTIATDIALNKLINVLVPTDYSMDPGVNFANDYNFGASDPKSDAYKTLGVMYGASFSEINAAYRRLAMQNHPDRGGDIAKFRTIQEAYELLNPNKQS